MNTNYEAVVSLIELLVKKAGFDLSKNYSEIELQKTKDSISSLMKERETASDKKALDTLIENLKVRQANWENNAEMVGKSLVKAYEEGKDYSTVKMRIELLGNLAAKGTSNISVGSVYDRIKSLDVDYKVLSNKIEHTDYSNEDEREMDLRYKSYLENKLSSIASEIESLDKELENLKEVKVKDESIVVKIKEYIEKLNKDKSKIDKAVSSSIHSDVAFDVWERLEKVKNNTDDKLAKANDLLSKTEEMLEEVRNNTASILERKKTLEAEQTRCNSKFSTVNTKLEENSYENVMEKMIDVNNSEMMKLELESLKNKKDVVYVDVGKVKEELIRAWSKERPPIMKRAESVETEKVDVIENTPEPVKATDDITVLKTEPVVNTSMVNNIERQEDKAEITDILDELDEIQDDLEETIEEMKAASSQVVKEISVERPEENPLEVLTPTHEEIEVLGEEGKDIIPEPEEKELEKVVLNDEDIEKVINNLDNLVKQKQVTNDVTQIKVEPKIEPQIKVEPQVKEKKNKIELDW